MITVPFFTDSLEINSFLFIINNDSVLAQTIRMYIEELKCIRQFCPKISSLSIKGSDRLERTNSFFMKSVEGLKEIFLSLFWIFLIQ